MKKGKSKYLILGILILILGYNIGMIIGAEASAELKFSGEWYSKGFSSISLWKSFVNTFVSTLFKFRVTNDDGNIKLGLKDDQGKEYIFDSYIKYDNKTGELSLQKESCIMREIGIEPMQALSHVVSISDLPRYF